MTEETLATIHRFNDAFNRHDVHAVMALMTDEGVFDNTRTAPDGERFVSQAAARAFWAEFFRRSPDARLDPEEIFAAGDRCVVRWTYHWVKDGTPGRVRGEGIFHVQDGKGAENLSFVNG